MQLWTYTVHYGTNLKFIFLVVNNCISFIEINNLLSLNCQYAPQNTRTYFARLQYVGSNTRMFTVLTIYFSWAWAYILLSQLVICLGYDPLIVFWRQNHVTFIFIKTMSHDLLVRIGYFIKDKANLWQPGQSKTQTELLLIQLQQWWARRTTPAHNFDYFILVY